MLIPHLPDAFGIITSGFVGLILGSFFNVVIYRVPREESVAFPASHCPSCNTPLKPKDNIPLLSWIFLKGKCRYCQTSISFQYPAIEALSLLVAITMSLLYFKTNLITELSHFLSLLILSLFTIPFFVTDIKHMILPNVLTYSGVILGLLFSLLPGGISIYQSLLGLVFTAGSLWLLGFITGLILRKEAMGLGDVKLVAMTGALFGFPTALLGIVLGSFLGLIFYIAIMVIRKQSQGQEIPFGPYICAGTLFIALMGISPELIFETLY